MYNKSHQRALPLYNTVVQGHKDYQNRMKKEETLRRQSFTKAIRSGLISRVDTRNFDDAVLAQESIQRQEQDEMMLGGLGQASKQIDQQNKQNSDVLQQEKMSEVFDQASNQMIRIRRSKRGSVSPGQLRDLQKEIVSRSTMLTAEQPQKRTRTNRMSVTEMRKGTFQSIPQKEAPKVIHPHISKNNQKVQSTRRNSNMNSQNDQVQERVGSVDDNFVADKRRSSYEFYDKSSRNQANNSEMQGSGRLSKEKIQAMLQRRNEGLTAHTKRMFNKMGKNFKWMQTSIDLSFDCNEDQTKLQLEGETPATLALKLQKSRTNNAQNYQKSQHKIQNSKFRAAQVHDQNRVPGHVRRFTAPSEGDFIFNHDESLRFQLQRLQQNQTIDKEEGLRKSNKDVTEVNNTIGQTEVMNSRNQNVASLRGNRAAKRSLSYQTVQQPATHYNSPQQTLKQQLALANGKLTKEIQENRERAQNSSEYMRLQDYQCESLNDHFRTVTRKKLILDPYQGHYSKPVTLNGRLNIDPPPTQKPIKDHVAIRKNLQELMQKSQNQFFAKRHTKKDRVFQSFNSTINRDDEYIQKRNIDKVKFVEAIEAAKQKKTQQDFNKLLLEKVKKDYMRNRNNRTVTNQFMSASVENGIKMRQSWNVAPNAEVNKEMLTSQNVQEDRNGGFDRFIKQKQTMDNFDKQRVKSLKSQERL